MFEGGSHWESGCMGEFLWFFFWLEGGGDWLLKSMGSSLIWMLGLSKAVLEGPVCYGEV